MLEKLPLLLNVVRAGGITPLLAPTASAAAAPPAEEAAAEAAADAAAVQDALECLVAAARSGNEGRAIAAESGALSAAVALLLRCPPAATQQLSLALQLLAAVLSDGAQRAGLQSGKCLGWRPCWCPGAQQR